MASEQGFDDYKGPLVAIVGPTAIGKTALSLRLAADFKGEVVSADSRQIYRGMDIGTAKVSVEERSRIPHYLIDIVEPDETFSLAQYQEAAYQVIDNILMRGRLPFLVGGTGLYIRAVLEGLGIPRVPPNPELRTQLYAWTGREGGDALHNRLARIDPQSAEAIDARNVRRVVRALEVYLETGRPISELQQATPPPYRILRIGLTMDRDKLYERIDERVEWMLETGLVEEVRRLMDRGCDLSLPSMSGVGYRQIGYYLRGEIDLAEAIRLIKHDTRRFVRQQYNWFRPDDPSILWFDVDEGMETTYPAVRQAVSDYLTRLD